MDDTSQKKTKKRSRKAKEVTSTKKKNKKKGPASKERSTAATTPEIAEVVAKTVTSSTKKKSKKKSTVGKDRATAAAPDLPQEGMQKRKRKRSTGETPTSKRPRVEQTVAEGMHSGTSNVSPSDAPHPATKATTRALAELERAREKGSVKYYNQLLATFAKEKNLSLALEAYFELRKRLQPTLFTYTNLLNACVRSGDVERARQVWKDMEDHGVTPNEVTYTVFLKGLCQDFAMGPALQCMSSMKARGSPANLRTYNTFLRGCLAAGDATRARIAYARMMGDGVVPDVHAIEYCAKVLSQAGMVEDTWTIVASAMERGITPSSASFVALGFACALANDTAGAQRALGMADKAAKVTSQEEALPRRIDGNAHVGLSRQALKMFAKAKNRETNRECARLRDFLQQDSSLGGTGLRLMVKDPRVMKLSSVTARQKRGIIDFKKVFGNDFPVKMEVCTGLGDWIVSHAEREVDVNWVAVEVRHDRVYHVWTKTLLGKHGNLLLLEGDAKKIISDCVADDCLTEVYVNYPEPPTWEASPMNLLTSSFLEQALRVLSPEGALTVVTDDKPYCLSVAELMDELAASGKSESAVEGESYTTFLPSDYGTSYFDRMWNRGGRTTRYCIRHTKLGTLHDSKAKATARQPGAPDAVTKGIHRPPPGQQPIAFVIAEPYFSDLKEGRKTIIGRMAKGRFLQAMSPGRRLLVSDGVGGDPILLAVTRGVMFMTFQAMLETEGVENVFPRVKGVSTGVSIYKQLFDRFAEREKASGCIALHVKPVEGSTTVQQQRAPVPAEKKRKAIKVVTMV